MRVGEESGQKEYLGTLYPRSVPFPISSSPGEEKNRKEQARNTAKKEKGCKFR